LRVKQKKKMIGVHNPNPKGLKRRPHFSPLGLRLRFLGFGVAILPVESPPQVSENNYLTEMYSGSKAGSYLRLIDLVYHSTLGLRVIKKIKKKIRERERQRD